MRLVYEKTGKPVSVGDVVQTSREELVMVEYFSKPHKPSSEGKVIVMFQGGQRREFYVSVIGAAWIEREDRI